MVRTMKIKHGKPVHKSKIQSQTAKALKAKSLVVKGVHTKVRKRVRTSVRFRRPKTLRLPRNPRYPRISVPKRDK